MAIITKIISVLASIPGVLKVFESVAGFFKGLWTKKEKNDHNDFINEGHSITHRIKNAKTDQQRNKLIDELNDHIRNL